jgi:hypothetical protein
MLGRPRRALHHRRRLEDALGTVHVVTAHWSRRRLRAVVLATLLPPLWLSACGGGGPADHGPEPSEFANQLFSDNFRGVCRGAIQSAAADYETSEAHRALYFESHKDDYVDRSTRLPSEWTVQFDPHSDALAAVDVVACAVRTPEGPGHGCGEHAQERRGSEGSSGSYGATYQLMAYEARTGQALGSTTIAVPRVECPSPSGGQRQVDSYASLEDSDIESFLRPFLRP